MLPRTPCVKVLTRTKLKRCHMPNNGNEGDHHRSSDHQIIINLVGCTFASTLCVHSPVFLAFLRVVCPFCLGRWYFTPHTSIQPNAKYDTWYSMVFDGTRWYSMVLDGTRWYSTALDGTRRYSTVLDGIRRYSMVLDGTHRLCVISVTLITPVTLIIGIILQSTCPFT
jgi:hypothetical protein